MTVAQRRLTRAESQAKTRDKLLEVAKIAFLRDGHNATSLDQIAEVAGFSKGAVYSNFHSKDELSLAVLDILRAERAALLGKAIASVKTLDERLAAVERWAERNIGDRAWTAFEVEFGVHAARHPQLRHALAERNKALRASIAALLGGLFDEVTTELPLSADDLALAILSVGIGLGMQRAVDASVRVRTLTDLLRMFTKTRKR